jgi:hypothetical protein
MLDVYVVIVVLYIQQALQQLQQLLSYEIARWPSER